MSTSHPTLARQIGRWITFAVLAVVLVTGILFVVFVVNYLGAGSCACQPSPPPTSTPIAALLLPPA